MGRVQDSQRCQPWEVSSQKQPKKTSFDMQMEVQTQRMEAIVGVKAQMSSENDSFSAKIGLKENGNSNVSTKKCIKQLI